MSENKTYTDTFTLKNGRTVTWEERKKLGFEHMTPEQFQMAVEIGIAGICEKCGQMYDVAKGHPICNADSVFKVFCQWCGENIYDHVVCMGYKMPQVRWLAGRATCMRCESKAAALLIMEKANEEKNKDI